MIKAATRLLCRTGMLCLGGLLVVLPVSAQKSGGGQGGGGGGGGGQTSDASGKGAQQAKPDSGSGSAQQYFVESDMLVYESQRADSRTAGNGYRRRNRKKIVLYNQQSFSNLQAYIGYRELVQIIAKGYDAASKTPVTVTSHAEVGFVAADILGAVKTGADILAGLRSSTEQVASVPIRRKMLFSHKSHTT